MDDVPLVISLDQGDRPPRRRGRIAGHFLDRHASQAEPANLVALPRGCLRVAMTEQHDVIARQQRRRQDGRREFGFGAVEGRMWARPV